jgi:hypothetical protein
MLNTWDAANCRQGKADVTPRETPALPGNRPSWLTSETAETAALQQKKMPEGDCVRSPAFSRCAAKTELCVTRRIFSEPRFAFASRGLHGIT